MIVLDASAALAALAGSSGARQAIAGRRLVAPHLVDVEIAHALRGMAQGGKIAVAEASRMLEVWQVLVVDRLPVTGALTRVWELRDNLTAYDAAYVALAERLELPLVTADRRLANAAGVRCRVELLPRN